VAAVPGRSTPEKRLAARTLLGLPLHGRCILFVGNDFRKKGLPVLMQALSHLPGDVFLAVVGNAAQTAMVQQELDASGQSARIYFLGALPAVDVAYQAADCLAHPTQEDTFAMVVLEAMAHGVPVVVSSGVYCGISALLTADVDALLLSNPHDPAALHLALERVLEEGTLTECLRMQGMRFARQHLWCEIALQQEAIYDSVAPASGTGAGCPSQ
jgi:UDP-glucose:(heptosyl)LPS alpha-1,3-glucosyltransferase